MTLPAEAPAHPPPPIKKVPPLIPGYTMGKSRQLLTLLAAPDALLVHKEDTNFALGCHCPPLLPHT